MSMQIESTTANSFPRAGKATKTGRKTYVYLFLGWVMLIAIGVAAAMLYTEHLRQKITTDIAQQTQQQLQVVQQDYQKQVSQLKDSVSTDMKALQTKVDALNELLAFTKDSANSKTDNSNQLYTQLAEVKKKLEELQKNLDVLK
ncbi:peptidoglycan hydrolase CwlO-like protein [Paenibacillus aceris]|uniref:Peptidoglycan hydrolase CwlO-like protein n=2 Tax=Paenibacillus aceris TaxID=869555 RepID=A0ABS4HUQ4_9BACL|nr:peptidoglycan hydrolase CwlO-like protein [Paenibacillus aceris]